MKEFVTDIIIIGIGLWLANLILSLLFTQAATMECWPYMCGAVIGWKIAHDRYTPSR